MFRANLAERLDGAAPGDDLRIHQCLDEGTYRLFGTDLTQGVGSGRAHSNMDVRKDCRINYCRRWWAALVVWAVWIVCQTEYVRDIQEAKDGFCISGAVRAAHRGADAGLVCDVVGEGSAAVCSTGSRAAATWRGDVYRRGSGMFDTDDRARSRRTEPIAG